MSRLKEFLLEWQWVVLVMACVVTAFFLLFVGQILMRPPGVVTPTAIVVTAVLPPTASPTPLLPSPSPEPLPTNTVPVPTPSQTPLPSPTPTMIPTEVLPTATPLPSPSPEPSPEFYVVRLHDNLSHIAERFFGSQRCWQGLYTTNKGIVGDDPNLIFAGQRYQLIYPCGR